MIKQFISVTSHALDPPSVTNYHTFSDPLPIERDVRYERALNYMQETIIKYAIIKCANCNYISTLTPAYDWGTDTSSRFRVRHFPLWTIFPLVP